MTKSYCLLARKEYNQRLITTSNGTQKTEKRMRLEEIEKLVAKGESEVLEFKKSTGQLSEATKTVCALLNGRGGVVVFGVADNGDIVGQHVATKTLEDISHELSRIDPPAFPKITTIATSSNKAIMSYKLPEKRKSIAIITAHIFGRALPPRLCPVASMKDVLWRSFMLTIAGRMSLPLTG